MMDYSNNWTTQRGRKRNLFPGSSTKLFDLNAIAGIKLPHPPTPPVRPAKDTAWWGRTSGGIQGATKPQNYQHLVDAIIKRMMNGG